MGSKLSDHRIFFFLGQISVLYPVLNRSEFLKVRTFILVVMERTPGEQIDQTGLRLTQGTQHPSNYLGPLSSKLICLYVCLAMHFFVVMFIQKQYASQIEEDVFWLKNNL